MKKQLIIDNEIKTMSFEETLNQFTPAIYDEIKKAKSIFDRRSEEYDDLFQNASIWLWKAFEIYDINRKNHFSTIAFPYIRKGVQEITDLNNAKKRGAIDASTSLEASLTSVDESFSLLSVLPNSVNVEDDVIIQDILDYFKYQISDKEQKALQFILEGRHSTELAEIENVTRQCSAARYRVVKRKFSKMYHEQFNKEGVLS